MGAIQPAEKVKLIAGLLAGDEGLLAVARDHLETTVGPIDRASEVWPFDHTRYYEGELGPTIIRQFVSFAAPAPMDHLADLKLTTNHLEWQIAAGEGKSPSARPVNIDPGYITLAKLVLATTKDRTHRIYLRDGIYAEVTLRFEKGAWRPWPWTYPDYAAPTYHDFFAQVRASFKEQRPGR
jgi:hypothetical protein